MGNHGPDVGSSATATMIYLVSLVDGPDPALAGVCAGLRGELRGITVPGGEILERPAVAGVVYAVWASPGVTLARLGSIAVWAEAAEPRPGLVACVPAGSAADAETALQAGFDDAVVGALSVRELAARLRAVHRRVHWQGLARPGRLRHGELTLDLDSHELWIGGATVQLTSTELGVVRALIRARGRTLSRSDLLDTAWSEEELEVSERAVDNVILRLRRKLPRPELIQTVRGVGFRLGE